MRAFRRGIIWLDGWWLAPLLYLLELSTNLREVSHCLEEAISQYN